MAEDDGDKTEAPTPRRRQEAREQGNIARSQDLTAAALIIGIMMMLDWYGPNLVRALRDVVKHMLSQQSLGDFDIGNLSVTLMATLGSVGRAMAPLLIGVVLLAVLVNIAQVGLFFNTKKLQPNFGALNPIKGFSKIFGGGQGGVALVMNFLKMTLVAMTAYSAVHGRIDQIVLAQQLTFIQIFGLGADLVYSIVLRIGILLLVLAILDYAWQRFRIEKQLKMTKQEVKEEMKRMDGDPKIKARRRQIAMQIATQKMKKEVPNADVVVTNPTHFAVALKYDSSNMHAPRVVAKGQDYMALKIREIAVAHGVPILERKPLARALFKMCEVGQEIPEQFYSAVAEILAYVYELSGKLKQKQAS
jgi:flagellar biosynthetic protein FlhB